MRLRSNHIFLSDLLSGLKSLYLPSPRQAGKTRQTKRRIVQSKLCGLGYAVMAGCSLAALPSNADAYTPSNHELSVRQGAKQSRSTHGVTISGSELKGIIKGVLEPDEPSFSSLQMLKQRFEPKSYGKQRNVNVSRIAAQSIHGSPNPTRLIYGDSAVDKQQKKLATRIPAAQLMPDRLPLEIYSYETNQAVRNKILMNASQFLCVSFAHKDVSQSARKFGNMLHMIGDTYSASHVQRSAPQGSPTNCGTEKIEWHFSMDLISWKQHRPADKQAKDWRFGCLVKHTSDLMKLWANGVQAVSQETSEIAKRARANEHVAKSMNLLCNSILREGGDVLQKPAGGAAAGYSSASGNDKWNPLKKKIADRPIQPIGLTGPKEAEAFYKSVNDALRKKGSPAQFWYPSRNMKDLCQGVNGSKPLPAPLRCTAHEISSAVRGSDDVKSMWMPRRAQ